MAVALSVLLGGCHEHVRLSAPPRDASFQQRVESYSEVGATSVHETHITYVQGGAVVGAAKRTDYLQLANGKRVHYPEDLLPVLPEESPSAEAARRSESARATGNTLFGVAIAGYTIGAGVMLYPVFNRTPAEKLDMTPMYAGLGLMVAGLVLHLVGQSSISTANDEKSTAFELYDKGLRSRLDLCVKDRKLVDCRQPAVVPVSTQEPADPETPDLDE